MKHKLGITFSPPHLEHLKIPVEDALKKAFEYNFSHIRLGTYWNRIESKPGHYDFSELTSILSVCESANQPVVVTVGVKAPRWPEYYWPDFITTKNTDNSETQHHLLLFIKNTILKLQTFKCITHWQIENEPYDPSGPMHLAISDKFLNEEVQLARRLDSRPLIISLWGNDLLSRDFFSKAEKLGDIVGLDIYYKQFNRQFFNSSKYRGPDQSDRELQKYLRSSSKPLWITELQAEPWEKNDKAYRSQSPSSMSPERLQENILKAQRLPIEEILLWGYEYWLWRSQKGDNRYLDTIRRNLL